MSLTNVRINQLPLLPSNLIVGAERVPLERNSSSVWEARYVTLDQIADYVPVRLSISSSALSVLQGLTATAAELNVLSGISPQLTTARLNYLAGVSPGVSQANKAAVLGTGRTLDYLNLTTLAVGGTTVQSSAAELNLLHQVPNGLTKQDLGMLPLLLRLFVNVFDVSLSFPDFATVSIGSSFNVVISNVRTFRLDICQGADVELYLNGHSGYVKSGVVNSSGSVTLTMDRGSSNTSTAVVVNSGNNTYHLKVTYRGVSLMTSGNFTGDGSSTNPNLDS